MPTTASIRAEVKFSMQLQEDEKFSETDVDRVILRTLQAHNPRYVTAESVPDREVEAVVALICHKLMNVRAAGYAWQANMSGPSGFGTDRNTPYYKCLEMARTFYNNYKELCTTLGLTTAVGSPVTSEVSSLDYESGAMSPSSVSQPPPALMITASTITDGVCYITFSFTPFSNFLDLTLITLAGNEDLLQPWNLDPPHGITGVNSNATVLGRFNRQDITQLKVDELLTNVHNRFAVVLRSKSGKSTLSNEAVVMATTS